MEQVWNQTHILFILLLFSIVSLPMDNSKNQNQLPEEKKTKSDSSDSLSEDIVQNIFTLLPIKNVIVTTSTVFRRYKKSWCHNRKFLFGRDFYSLITYSIVAKVTKLKCFSYISMGSKLWLRDGYKYALKRILKILSCIFTEFRSWI